ncbi:MAG TPA: hypothetical protein VG125_03930, partial [Pirellulales bacterium]|nr:hypothetical protein [Pirellulales bacterium]
MQRRRMRLNARPVVAVTILIGILALAAGIDRRDRLRHALALETSQTAYRNARHARERAEA